MKLKPPPLDFWHWLLAGAALVVAGAVYLTIPDKVAPPIKATKIEDAG